MPMGHGSKRSQISTESHFAKFNACQSYLLYGIEKIDCLYACMPFALSLFPEEAEIEGKSLA